MENEHGKSRRRQTYPSPDTQGFARLLYAIFILEKKHRVEEIAPQLDRSPSALYGYIEGTATFPPDLIEPLYLATHDRRVLEHFLDPCGVCFYELPEIPVGECSVTIWRQVLRSQREALDVMEQATEILADGVVTHAELLELRRQISEAQTEFARLMACAEIMARRRR